MTTITHEQFEAAKGAAQLAISGQHCALTAALAALGITVTPPSPPEAMAKLARDLLGSVSGCDSYKAGLKAGSLAALQHVEKLVWDAPAVGVVWRIGDNINRPAMLKKLGADA